MLDQQPKTNHQVRQHPQPEAGQATCRQLLAPGKPGLGIHSQALPAPHFVGVRRRGGGFAGWHIGLQFPRPRGCPPSAGRKAVRADWSWTRHEGGVAGTTGTGAGDTSPFRVNPQLLKAKYGGTERGVDLIGVCPQKCLGAQNTAVPGTGSPWGRASPVTRRGQKGNARSPGQRGSAAQNAVALLVHRAGLEQQRNTKAKIIKRKRYGPHLCPVYSLQGSSLPPRPALTYLHEAGSRVSM
ncbi:uncharacterized protein LOC116589211 [Mustela erminea]|uniref:uncharacterized protein LOC116589211 n=1 Tax=Mustela erminea TaxID=36723 RepID=UPI00138703BF|nr:uncharacterized protein LOC116589211 [Mustela erminea]